MAWFTRSEAAADRQQNEQRRLRQVNVLLFMDACAKPLASGADGHNSLAPRCTSCLILSMVNGESTRTLPSSPWAHKVTKYKES